MKYTAKYFKESLPEWKRKKDSILGKLIYRPISFPISSFLSNRGVSANIISYSSIFIALMACTCFLLRGFVFHIVGTILVAFWIVMDCVDGNIARSVKKIAFGDFADGIGGYILLAF